MEQIKYKENQCRNELSFPIRTSPLEYSKLYSIEHQLNLIGCTNLYNFFRLTKYTILLLLLALEIMSLTKHIFSKFNTSPINDNFSIRNCFLSCKGKTERVDIISAPQNCWNYRKQDTSFGIIQWSGIGCFNISPSYKS